VRELRFQRGSLNFSKGPPAARAGPIRCWREWILDAIFAVLFFSIGTCVLLMISRQLFCTDVTDVVVRSHTTVPLAFHLPFLCVFTNSEVEERYLKIIRDAGTPFPCVPRHFNHCLFAVLNSGLPASGRSHMRVLPHGTLCPTTSAPRLVLSSSENCSDYTILHVVKLLIFVDLLCFRCVLAFGWLL